MSRSGADLALLLLSGFRVLAHGATNELVARGYDVRPVHEFALRAILSGADNASALGRRMLVSKQAAAKTVAALEERHFVGRELNPFDKREMRLRVTDRGHEMLREGAAIFDGMRQAWEQQVGMDTLAKMEGVLAELVGKSAIRFDFAALTARDLEN
jgi:DNA-binding MarR family transcriptional regulator